MINSLWIEVPFLLVFSDLARGDDKFVRLKGEIIRLFKRDRSGSHQAGSLASRSAAGERLLRTKNDRADENRHRGDETSGQENNQLIHG